jgi:ribosomal protein S18 acetylase RimI-like enzyme
MYFNLFPLSEGFRINDFQCEIDEYSIFLQKYAIDYQKSSIAHTHLLINKSNADIVAYMTLVTDSIKLKETEKEDHELNIPISAFPALKVAKLAVNSKYREKYTGIGRLMLVLARGFVAQINECGVSCEFITIDADVENNPSVIEFYEKNDFLKNEQYIKKKNRTISMRLSVDNDSNQEQKLQQSGTE